MSLPLQHHIEKDGFRLRGLEVSRIDGFSDVVFGFALTLLVVSLEVPKTYAELHEALRGFLPFAISFFILMRVWYAHYQFFRRLGLHDTATIIINALLLFVVLFYVYPLKFLFTFLSAWALNKNAMAFETDQQVAELMILYGLGVTAIYLLFAALYCNGWRQRKELDLNAVEMILLRGYILDLVGLAAVGLLSCLVAKLLPAHLAGYSGWIYVLISPVGRVVSRITRSRIAKLKRDLAQAAPTPDEVLAETPNAHS
jgi:uncharacterized membrane protein